MFLNPTSVRVSWSTSQVDKVEKYDVTYKPTDARCVPAIFIYSISVVVTSVEDVSKTLTVSLKLNVTSLRSFFKSNFCHDEYAAFQSLSFVSSSQNFFSILFSIAIYIISLFKSNEIQKLKFLSCSIVLFF